MPVFTVFARSRASAIFFPGKALDISFDTGGGKTRLVYRTEYRSGFDAPLPTDFCVEVNGEANGIDEAVQKFHQLALDAALIIAFVVNADLGHLEVELAFDSSPNLVEHAFLQTFIPDRPILHIPGRPIDPDAVNKFQALLVGHKERDRLQRAIVQYCEALRRWTAGNGLICLGHLYMGVDALTKAVLRDHLAKNGKTENDLLVEWDIDIKRLDGEVRLRFIFDGDKVCFQAAKQISDTFEHGYDDFAKLRQPAAQIVVKVARYLRRAIIMLAGASPELSEQLLTGTYGGARGPFTLVKKLRGTLVGTLDKLAQDGKPHPRFDWQSSVKRVILDENGIYGFDPEETMTGRFGDGTVLRDGSYEIWDNQLVDPKTVVEANAGVPVLPISVVRHAAEPEAPTSRGLVQRIADFFRQHLRL
ncbi:MAG TPA: hypothetical protein VHZ29_02105 [Rhizomicrobium sp.]|jgi:hypothetical protein|nr:hypothetical protein [Rhizomicrobium sp.]